MARENERTVAVGVFDDRTSLERALGGLRDAGFSDDQVGVLHHTDDEGEATNPAKVAPETRESATAGAVTGGVLGGVAGALIAGMIPGVGPILAGGILAGVLGGAALGAAGGVVRTLLDLGVPEEESRLYEQEFAAGRSILAVKAGDRHAEAVDIMRDAGANIVRRREAEEPGAEYRPGDPTVAPDTGVAVEDPLAKEPPHATGSSPRETYEGRGTQPPDTSGASLEDQEPALQFGWERAMAPGRHAQHWTDAEPVLRRDWEAEHPDTPWETVADLVRQGWEDAVTPGARKKAA